MGLITREQWLREQRGARSWVVSPGTATSATMDLTQCRSLSPGLCRSLVKESYSSSHCPPQSEFCSPVGVQGEDNQTGESICEVIGAIKPETEDQVGRESPGNYMRLGMLVLLIDYR